MLLLLAPEIIFKLSTEQENFTLCGKANQNPWPSIGGKIFARLLYKNMFNIIIKKHSVPENQSGFIPGDYEANHAITILLINL